MNTIFMGSPGVGKGTQSRRLSDTLGIPAVSSGDMFRHIREEDNPLAQDVRRYMDGGEYVPDDLTIKMVLDRLNQPDACGGFILDGFPRTVPQAQALDEALATHGRKIDHVILLEAPQEVILSRLADRWICSKCGLVYNTATNPARVPGVCDSCGSPLVQRSDEAPDVQRHRLEVFARQTEPVVEFYEHTGRLKRIDASQPVDEVTTEILALTRDGVGA